MADTAALVVALSAQLTKFEKDMKGAVDIANKHTKEIENSFAKMNTAVNSQLQSLAQTGVGGLGQIGIAISRLGPFGLAAAAGIGALAVGFTFLSNQVADYVHEAGKLVDAAETTGLTIVQLKELSKVGAGVGVSAEQIEGAVGKMTVALDATKDATGPLYEALRKIPGALQSVLNAKDSAEAIDALTFALAQLGSQTEKNAFLRQAFGRGGLVIGRVLNELAKQGGLKEVAKDSELAGTAINEKLATEVDALSDKIVELENRAKLLWGEAFGKDVLEAKQALAEYQLGVAELAAEINTRFRAGESVAAATFRAVRNRLFGITNLSGETTGPTLEQAGLVLGPEGTAAPPTPAVPLPRARPDDIASKNLADQIRKMKELIDAVGQGVTISEKFTFAQLTLNKALADGKIEKDTYTRATEELNEEQERAIEIVRRQLGIASNQQILESKIVQARREAAKAGLDEAAAEQRVRFEHQLTTESVRQQLGIATAQQDLQTKIARARDEARKAGLDQAAAERQVRIEADQSIATLRERLGVATEEQIVIAKTTQVREEARKAGLSEEETLRAVNVARREAIETAEQLAIRLSKLPSVTRAAFDSTFIKQFDQFVVGTMSNFENAMADVAVGSKSLAEAFKSMADSIIRDLVRMAIRMSVTGPLMGALGGLFSGGAGGGFNLNLSGFNSAGFMQRQRGGPVAAGSPYIVGEHGPELFVPKSSGQIVPSSIGKTAGAGLSVVVNNYAAQDTQTTQRREQQGPKMETLVIDIVKREMSSGGFDSVNRGRFGLRAQKVR